MGSNRFNNRLPVFSLLFAATMWGLFWWPLRLIEANGIDRLWITLVAYLVSLAVGLLLMRGRWHEITWAPGRLFAIALASGWCNLSFIVAVTEKDVARVVLLFYLSVVWSILLGIIFLKEKPDRKAILVSVLALTGAVFMLWDPQKKDFWPRDAIDWLALSSGLTFSIANVLVRGVPRISVQTKAFVNWLGVSLLVIIGIVIYAPAIPVAEPGAWFACIALGLLGVLLMTLAVQYGVSRLPIYQSAILLLFEVLVAVISAYLLTNERLSVLGWIGGLFIFISALVYAWAGQAPKMQNSSMD